MLVGAFVPWMPMPARLSPIQWRPIGLSGPGGTEVSTGLRSARISAWIDGGTTQVLSICRFMTRKSPVGVGHVGRPKATG